MVELVVKDVFEPPPSSEVAPHPPMVPTSPPLGLVPLMPSQTLEHVEVLATEEQMTPSLIEDVALHSSILESPSHVLDVGAYAPQVLCIPYVLFGKEIFPFLSF